MKNIDETENLIEYRKIIDECDDILAATLIKRMSAAKSIGEIKRKSNIAVEDPSRENAVLLRITEGKTDEQKKYLSRLYEKIFELSKALQ